MNLRHPRYPRRWARFTGTVICVAIFVTLMNILLVALYTYSVPVFLATAYKRGIRFKDGLNGPPLFDSNSSASEPCGEGTGRLFSTGWILKLVNLATKHLREYRRKNLEILESGGNPDNDQDIFSAIAPVLSLMNSGSKEKMPDLMTILPKLLELYSKVQQSGLFAGPKGNGPSDTQFGQWGKLSGSDLLSQILSAKLH